MRSSCICSEPEHIQSRSNQVEHRRTMQPGLWLDGARAISQVVGRAVRSWDFGARGYDER